MSILMNILWLVFGGFFVALGYMIGGALLCATIVGIPFGMQAINLGVASLAPFGKSVVRRRERGGFLALVFDVIWLLLFGWEIAIANAIGGLLLCITIVGIPFGVQLLKLVPVALVPFPSGLVDRR